MAQEDKKTGGGGLSRRDFLKTTAAATAVGAAGLDFAFDAAKAEAYEGVAGYTIKPTTCPYCSASCGQRVVVRNSDQVIVDMYGDFESPMNSGGLCAKGAGALQLANNKRRLGAWTGEHPVNNVFAADGTTNGIAYKRDGSSTTWTPVALDTAMADIATKLKAARDADSAGFTSGIWNSKSVAFFGSSHMNNEPNFVYRKTIAAFGTSNVEHQARI